MRSDQERLNDILQAISKIVARAPVSLEVFLGDEMLQVWVIYHLQVIGEAARAVSESLRDRHPEVPWPQIIALRNILVHEYFGLNMEQVWTMMSKDLPALGETIGRIRSAFPPDSEAGS